MRTEELLSSNNTTLASLQSTVYYKEVYAILLRPILTVSYHMLINLRLLKVLHPSTMLQERMNIQNILLMRFKSTVNSIGGSNLSLDRYFTSASLAEWALEKN